MVLSWLDQDAIAEVLHPNYKEDLSNWQGADLRKEVVDVNLLQEAGRIPQELWNAREKHVAAVINTYVESLNVAPVITALEPNTAVLGSPDVTMVVVGTGFVRGHSTIFFNGFPEPTTWVDETHVSTGVKPSIFTVAEALPVLVRNESAESNSLDWTFTEAAGAATASRGGRKVEESDPLHRNNKVEDHKKR